MPTKTPEERPLEIPNLKALLNPLDGEADSQKRLGRFNGAHSQISDESTVLTHGLLTRASKPWNFIFGHNQEEQANYI